ncbi:U-box domain-containing protein [Trifolium repens]|nr:U-box domain-containing protein [Trifolium repens]
MALDSFTSGPALEAISQIIDTVSEFVFVKKGSFKELGDYLQRIAPILKQLRKEKVSDSETFNIAIEILNREIKDAKKLVQECSKKSKVYLLVNCRTVANRLKHNTSEISRAFGLLPLATSGLSAGTVEEIERLRESMQAAEFKAAVSEEEILEKIELGIQEKNFNRSYANDLLLLIADALGITKERSTLKKELEEFKSEIENEKDRAEAIQMDQIIALLDRSDAASSTREKEQKYFAKRDSLDTSILRPNKTLKQSIEEWKDRNTVITIASMREKIQSGDEVGVLNCLQTLQGITNHVLVILCMLMKDNEDAKERIAKVDNAIESIVDSLGRRLGERKLAVALLLELSKYDLLREYIGKVQGCILLALYGQLTVNVSNSFDWLFNFIVIVPCPS